MMEFDRRFLFQHSVLENLQLHLLQQALLVSFRSFFIVCCFVKVLCFALSGFKSSSGTGFGTGTGLFGNTQNQLQQPQQQPTSQGNAVALWAKVLVTVVSEEHQYAIDSVCRVCNCNVTQHGFCVICSSCLG